MKKIYKFKNFLSIYRFDFNSKFIKQKDFHKITLNCQNQLNKINIQKFFRESEKKFLEKCKKVGVNGLIIVDLPWPENKSFTKKCIKKSLQESIKNIQ